MTIWNGRSSSTASSVARSPISARVVGSGRSSRSVSVTAATRERGPQPGTGAAAVGLVQPHDHVATTVLGELDRLDDDRWWSTATSGATGPAPSTSRSGRLAR